MNGRERIKHHLHRRAPDRIGFYESMMWAETYERWYGEGYPRGVRAWDFFEFDLRRVYVLPTFNFPDTLVEDQAESQIRRDANGALYRMGKGLRSDASGIEYLDYLIKTRDDWEEHCHCLQVGEDRFTGYWRDQYAECRSRGLYVFLSTRQPLWAALNKVGLVRFMELMYDDPGWVHDMVGAHLQFLLDAVEMAEGIGCPVDGVYMTNGTSMKGRSLLSPQFFWEFGAAYDKILVDRLAEKDMEVMLHFDGNFAQLLDETVRSGVHAVAMIECRAGMDVIQLKQQVGDRLAFMGNIDVDVLSTGDRERIEEEVRTKVLAAKEGGGFIFHSDGSIPPTVSFVDYLFAYDLARCIGWYEK